MKAKPRGAKCRHLTAFGLFQQRFDVCAHSDDECIHRVADSILCAADLVDDKIQQAFDFRQIQLLIGFRRHNGGVGAPSA